jgi:hypothetical protein
MQPTATRRERNPILDTSRFKRRYKAIPEDAKNDLFELGNADTTLSTSRDSVLLVTLGQVLDRGIALGLEILPQRRGTGTGWGITENFIEPVLPKKWEEIAAAARNPHTSKPLIHRLLKEYASC